MHHLPDDDDWLLERRRLLGDRIRAARLDRNLTQEQVFLAAHVARATYQDVEAGARDARISTLLRIAHVLGVHVTDLLH